MMDMTLFLVLLPITDCVPIIVILVYHFVTMRHTECHQVASPSVSGRVERLYSIDDFCLDTDCEDLSSKESVHFHSIVGNANPHFST